MNYLKTFIEDSKYYDPKNIEVKTILKNVNLKGKTVLDIGAGIGRLSFPLAKYAKKIVVLDQDKRLKSYFKKHKKENIEFVNQKAKEYLKDNEKFDIILLAWPTFDFQFLDLIKNAMHKSSIFVFITCDNNSDYETIINKLDTGKGFDHDISNKQKFMEILPKKFNILIKEKIKTEYIYPNEKEAFRIIKSSMTLWFDTKFNKKVDEKLLGIINNHKKGNKIKFGEEIYFYLSKLK